MNTLKMESQLRTSVIDRLISAAISEGRPARDDLIASWKSSQNVGRQHDGEPSLHVFKFRVG